MSEQTTFVAGTAPGALPVMGHGLQLLRNPVEFMTSLSAHGDLVRIKLGPTSAYVPTHPDLLRYVLANDRIFDKGGVFYDRIRDVAGNGLVTCPFADHRRQRRLIQPAFTRSQLKRYATAMRTEIEATATRWHDGMVIDAFPEMYSMALRTVARTLYSTPVSTELASGVEHAFEIVLNGVFRQMFLPRFIRGLPLPANRRYQNSLRFLHETTQHLIDDYRSDGTEHDDLLAALIASRDDDGGRLDDKEIHDQVITVMGAGTETVASTLTWVFYLLSQHPEIERALYEEIDTVLDGRPPNWDDLENLSLADRIISEALRLHSPAWLLTRLTTSETELAGLRLPEGTTVIFSPVAVARYEDAFDDPAKFDPDRWLPDRVSPLTRQAFMPFGTGARKCIGDLYARTEATLGLATILSRWRVTCEPDMDIRPVPLATVYHLRRLRLKLSARRCRPGVGASI